MTAPTRNSIVVFDASVAAGIADKAAAMAGAAPAAGNGGWIDISGYNGGEMGWSIINGSSAPTVNPSFTVQFASASNALLKATFDRWTGGGNTTPNSVTSGLIPIPSSAKYARGLGYGHQTNPVGLYLEAMLKG